VILALLLACAEPAPAPQPAPEEVEEVVTPVAPPFEGALLDAPALLRRASLDLRGVLPSLDEVAAVEADPAAVDALIAGFVDDPRYERRLVDLFAEHYLTRVEVFNLFATDFDLPPEQDFAYRRSVGEEPLRLLARVAVEDRPWTDAVTTDQTLANPLLLSIWPLEDAGEPADAEGWRPARYTDGRPAGGAVMTNGLWWRYYTTPNNYNRSRAAALSRLFLCEDFLTRPISFEAVAILDRESLNEDIQTIPACVGCHSTLDPLAASLFGFWWFDIYTPVELNSYHAEREQMGPYYLETEMAWFGEPMADPADLGPLLAADPRYTRCAVEVAAKALWRRPAELADFATVSALAARFEEGGLRHKTLVRAILEGEDYRVGGLLPEAGAEAEARLSTRRMLSPEQMESAVADLTGFIWRYGGYDQLTNDVYGYRVLAGGMDGQSVTRPEAEPTLTQALVMKRLSQAAAQHVVHEDFFGTEGRRLLAGVSMDDRPGDAGFEAALLALHRRLFSRSPTEDELEEARALWQKVHDGGGVNQAWASLIAVLLRDPSFWTI
jgi:hypothetical protein